MAIDLPDWGKYLFNLGSAISQLPTVEYGEQAPRVILSLPTGRFSYWLLTAGAMTNTPQLTAQCSSGDRVATWDSGRMKDCDLEDADGGRWRLASGQTVVAGDWPVVAVPPNTPGDRRSARVAKDYKLALAALPGHRHDYHKWFAAHCLKPIVTLGTGREHIQNQREILLDHAAHWFNEETQALLSEDSNMTSNPDRMLFHPYMVLDAGVGHTRPWINSLLPRLVIVTAWGARQRMHGALFSRVPHVIITNRRVKSFVTMEEEMKNVQPASELEKIVNSGRPDGIYANCFFETAQGVFSSVVDEDEDEEFDI